MWLTIGISSPSSTTTTGGAVHTHGQNVTGGADGVRRPDAKQEPWSASLWTTGPRALPRWSVSDHGPFARMIVVRNPGVLSLLLLLMMVMCAARGLEAADGDEAKKPKTLEERNLWRFEWDNDAFVRVDNGFTEGWSLERHSHQYDTWDEMKPSKFSADSL